MAQTFFMDEELAAKMRLDGIVTLVDAKHVIQHLDDTPEVVEQIAFADVILLNKVDLVEPAMLDKLESRIHAMNAAAKMYRTQEAVIDLDRILNVGGFNVIRGVGNTCIVNLRYWELHSEYNCAVYFYLAAFNKSAEDPTMG